MSNHAVIEELTSENRLLNEQLKWYRYYLTLQLHNIKPLCEVTVEGIQHEYLTGQVYTPQISDGGLIKLIWQRFDDRELKVVQDSVAIGSYLTFIENQADAGALPDRRELARLLKTKIDSIKAPSRHQPVLMKVK